MAKKLLADYDVYDLVLAITYAGFVEESPWLQGASGQGGGLGNAFPPGISIHHHFLCLTCIVVEEVFYTFQVTFTALILFLPEGH